MSVELSWHDEQQIIVYAKYLKGWTWEDLYVHALESRAMIDASPHNHCYMIADISESLIPKGSASLHGTNVMKNRHPKLRLVVITTPNTVVRAMVRVMVSLNSVTQQGMRIAASVEDAEQIIRDDQRQLIGESPDLI